MRAFDCIIQFLTAIAVIIALAAFIVLVTVIAAFSMFHITKVIFVFINKLRSFFS